MRSRAMVGTRSGRARRPLSLGVVEAEPEIEDLQRADDGPQPDDGEIWIRALGIHGSLQTYSLR